MNLPRSPTHRNAVALVFLALLACKTRGNTAQETDETTVPEIALSAAPPPSAAAARAKAFAIGETAKTSSYELTVVGVEECKRRGFTRPKNGNLWLGVEVRLTSISSRELVANPRDAKLVDAEGVSFNYTYVFKSTCEPRLDNTRLQRDDKARGFLVFEIPEGSRGLELVFDPILVEKPEAVRFDLNR